MQFLQIPVIDEQQLVSKADSAKVTIESFAHELAENPQGALQGLLQDVIQFGIKLLAALLIYCIGAWLIKRVRKLLIGLFTRRQTDKTLASFVMSLVSITLTVLLIIVSISTLGVNTTSLAALLAAGGMAIGMALSGTVQNFAGGIMILAFKPFKSGDFIEAQGYMGTVNTVSIVSTTLTTPDNREIVIPNGALFNGSIDNYSRSGLRRVEWLVNVEYGTDSDKCKEQLMKIMKSDERILDASEKGAADPVVMLKSMESSSVVFTARGWVKADDYWDVFFQVNEEIYKKLPESGISFPFPQLDVRVKNMDS